MNPFKLDSRLIETATAILEGMGDDIRKMQFFHGTYSRDGGDSLDVATKIAQHGIQPPDLSGVKEHGLRPVEGNTYATPDVGYAQMYAIGGNVAGSTHWNPKHSHGYVFQFSGHQLNNVQPDEDELGKLYYKKTEPIVTRLANAHATEPQRRRAADGEYEFWAKMGKRILPKMTDVEKLHIIKKHNTHVANTGSIVPERAFRISMDKIPLLAKDGSNFFEHAEEVDLEHLKQGIVRPI